MYKSANYASAEDYYNTSTHQQQMVFIRWFSAIEVKPGFKCLDIGCGSGNNTALLAGWVGKDGCVVGIDPDQKRIEVAIENYKNSPNLKFVVGKSIDIPMCDGGYDLVISNLVMHWIDLEEKLVTYEKVFSALKPGGSFVITEISRAVGNIFRFLSFASKEVQDEIMGTVHCISPEKNREIFEKIGFEVDTIEEGEHSNNFKSLDFYCRWLDSTLHGKINSRKIFDENKELLNLRTKDDGSIVHVFYHSYMVLRKPY